MKMITVFSQKINLLFKQIRLFLVHFYNFAIHRFILTSSIYSFWFRDRRKMWQFFSNEVSFIWFRPPTHPLQMKVWKTEYRCIINQTPPNNIGFRTMYSPYACHDRWIFILLKSQTLDFRLSVHIIQQTCCTNKMIFID
jgi:hypothetical protein